MISSIRGRICIPILFSLASTTSSGQVTNIHGVEQLRNFAVTYKPIYYVIVGVLLFIVVYLLTKRNSRGVLENEQ